MSSKNEWYPIPITIKDKKYPEKLKKIPDPPQQLFVRGDLSIAKKNCFAIVGARRCSPYGKQIAMEIAGNLADAGIIIVSGLAKGIDTAAHQGCLERKGKTIAVLGTGIDEKSIYPQENLKLSQKIIDTGGAVISEFSSDTPGYKSNFPSRNRIISGLCSGILIVEAKYKSGALITARLATEQNKKLFAVPGPVHVLNSQGTNNLIKQGKAKLVENARDILKELNLQKLNFQYNEKQEVKGDNEQKNLILGALKQESLDIDGIIEKTNLSAQDVASALSVLEIRDKVRNLRANIFAIKR